MSEDPEIIYTDAEAEGVVLGAMMASPDILADIAHEVGPDTFATDQGQVIYRAIASAAADGHPADFITVTRKLEEQAALERAGGHYAVSSLATGELASSLTIVRHHLDRLRALALDREAAKLAHHMGSHATGRNPLKGLEQYAPMLTRLLDRASEGATLPGKSIMDLAATPPNPEKTVLGNRFLCAGGGMLFVGSSGIGKSSASVQQDILWSLGREAFGIRPARPLSILTIQAENDDGDLGEMASSVADGLQLGGPDMERVRVHYVTEDTRTGEAFLAMLPRLLSARKWGKWDLLRIDPLLAYLGADILDSERTAAFLRNGLNPILRRFGVACIINHHTPKTNNRDTSNYRASDWMYAGAGNADITNWARAALMIEATHAPHVFKFVAAKRGSRIGWSNSHGEREILRHYCHAETGIFWREATPEDLQDLEDATAAKKSGKTTKTPEDFKRLVPITGAVSKTKLLESARAAGFSKRGATETLDALIERQELYPWGVTRPGVRPEIRISRHEQELTDAT